MAGFIGDALRNAVLDAILGASHSLTTSTLEIALYTVAPTSAGGGTEVSSGGGSGYSPILINNDGSQFGAASGAAKLNLADWDFGVAGTAWGTVIWAALRNPSSHVIIIAAPLATSRVVLAGDEVVVPAGSFTATAA